ncbi:hypothetical protein [Microbacterium sp. P5_E9]
MTSTPTADRMADASPVAVAPRLHGAHRACQVTAPFVRSHCGLALEDSGQVGVGTSPSEPCALCLDIATCVVCSAPVTTLRTVLGL